jgi:hypothetical protein
MSNAKKYEEFELLKVFLSTSGVAQVRAALGLPANLGKREKEFVRLTMCLMQRLGKPGPGEEISPEQLRATHFGGGWTDIFNQELRSLRKVLEASLNEEAVTTP